MKSIKVSNFLSTNLFSEFNSIMTIEIEDKPIAEGAFGEVFICLSVNSQSLTNPQVIKIFKEDNNNKQDHNVETILKLQKKLSTKENELKTKNNTTIIEKYPALKGVPQFSFTGILNGKTIRGFSSSNLKKLGFEEFIDVLEKDSLYKSYQALGIDKKMLIAYRLVSAFKLLNELYFIHADLKPEAIFINSSNSECAIIDFDSGTVTENPNDEPNTWGAPNDWVAPEIWEQLKQQNSNGLQKIKVNLLSDLWSVAVGVHYILTTTHPLFYLNELSPRTANQYFSKFKWPNIDTSEAYFNINNSTIYQPINNWLTNVLPKSIFDQFYNTINFGYSNPIKRTTYNEWEKVLLSVQEPPKILNFESDRELVINGVPVVFSWNVTDYFQLVLNDGKQEIEVSLMNSFEVKPKEDTKYKLIAKGHFGNSNSEYIEVRVFPVPMIKTITIETPKFNNSIELSNFSIGKPELNLSIDLTQSNFIKKEFSFTELCNEGKVILQTKKQNSPISEIFENLQTNIFTKLKNKIINGNN
jgi:serine/threonine protein kinase